MTVTASATIVPHRQPRASHPARPAAPPTSASAAGLGSARTGGRHGRGGRVLFEIPFRSAMSDPDLARLARLLDLTTHMHPKMRPDPTSPGVARLDHFSGLYLERGAEAGEWVLEARTWGRRAPETVRDCELRAAWAAGRLDPAVRFPGWREPAGAVRA